MLQLKIKKYHLIGYDYLAFALIIIATLLRFTLIYFNWTCNRLIFQSNEKLTCSSLDEKLGPGFDRYMPYRTLVNTTEDAAYVFPQNAPQIAVLDAKMQNHTLKRSYQRQEFGNYVIYYVPRP